jgi:hypothetical protein
VRHEGLFGAVIASSETAQQRVGSGMPIAPQRIGALLFLAFDLEGISMVRWRKGLITFGLVSVMAWCLAGCADDYQRSVWDVQVSAPEITVPTSLHGTTRGMGFWYDRAQNGLEQFTNIPYEDLACGGCHATCQSCHEGRPGDQPVSSEKCLACHSRQGSEIALGYPDVHRDAGMGCADCHSLLEVHGDGNEYNSMFEAGAREVNCQTCHQTAPGGVAEHQVHEVSIACQSCHMVSSVTCVNCHFESEIVDHKKVAFSKFHGWQFLGNWEGKVYPFNFQSVEYLDHTLVAYGPYTGHTVTKEGRQCDDCHGTPYVEEYQQNKSIKLVRWDEAEQKLVGAKGLIPIPPDFRTSLKHDFATLVNGEWQFLEEGPDVAVMVYGQPLTSRQITLLGAGGG